MLIAKKESRAERSKRIEIGQGDLIKDAIPNLAQGIERQRFRFI